jgi:hypothetical protein
MCDKIVLTPKEGSMKSNSEKSKKWREKQKEKDPGYFKKYNDQAIARRRSDPETNEAWNARMRDYGKKQRAQFRDETIELLGGKCVLCGYSDRRALQIDHINGGGSKELKNRTSHYSYTKAILTSVRNKEGKYQLLCANCNWIKRHETGENEKWKKQ